MDSNNYLYDLFVIGGGSGGLATAKEAADLGKKVCLADFVKPTPIGNKWGLGGTCVNVGCIPKKMYHFASKFYETLEEAQSLGYPSQIKKEHDWAVLKQNVRNHISSTNFGYRNSLRAKNVTYANKLASIIDNHTIELTDARGNTEIVTADKILIAVGGRPTYPDIEGAKEYCITSDDVFFLNKPPKKTLVVGAAYIALECGGFINAFGYETSVMVRSILLRNFDKDAVNNLEKFMVNKGMRFIKKSIPVKFTRVDPDTIKVDYKNEKGEILSENFNTVLLAVGRTADTAKLFKNEIGVKLTPQGKIIVDETEKTTVDNIFAIGDCADGKPELTPVAIKAGKLLARRLFGESTKLMDYKLVPTTIFTPIEYGAIGYTEEEAINKFGKDNIISYHSEFAPTEWCINPENHDTCYMKIVVNKKENNKVIGFHVLSPYSGEITQGIAAAMHCGITKEQLDDTLAIHPTVAEEFTMMKTTTAEELVPSRGCANGKCG